MASIIDQTRQLHADIEKCERGVMQCLKERETLKRHKDVLWNEHRMCHLCEEAGDHTAKLKGIYEDANGSRRQELVALSGGGRTEVQFKAFNEKMREIQDYYRKFPTEPLEPGTQDGGDEEAFPRPDDPVWSGEEFWGRYLDLNVHHESWINLPGNKVADAEPISYADYADAFGKLDDIPIGKKTAWGSKYHAYVKLLRMYLDSFATRAQPLLKHTDPWTPSKSEFDAAWAAGTVQGWGKPSAAADAEDSVDLEQHATAAALAEAVSPDALKAELTRLGLKCGGNLAQRADRLFATKGKAMSEWPPAIFAGAKNSKRKREKSASAAAVGVVSAAPSATDYLKEAAWEEVQTRALMEVLEEVVAATRIQIEKKQTRTLEELEAELDADIAHEGDSDDDDEEKAIYNPKNLPLGWDGKPIPYWLYKLHGLNIEYNCEICGNYKYVGPRAYDRHFHEWRHTHGLKCLGIVPDLFKYFHGVVLIEDALSLYKQIKGKGTSNEFKTDRDEELEDDDGNVYAKKVFDDLKKQGIITSTKDAQRMV